MKNGDILNGRYRIVQQQAAGGMAVVYKAIDQALGRTVAVKILRPNLLANDPTFLPRFQNEARNVANLKHPNIVTVHDIGNDGDWHYIVMEFVEGQDLKKVIKAEGALSIERVLNLGTQICAGIGFAHRAGLVHADVKPQNILVTAENVVKVTDFGIAQALTESKPGERQAVVWGSPHYFAPEQARGEKPSPASDVYSIGIVLFEMLTGRLPYTGTNQQELALAHIRNPIPLVTDFNSAIPSSLAQIVYKMMSKEPAARYRNADQVMHVLTTYREKGTDISAQMGYTNPTPNAPTVQNIPRAEQPLVRTTTVPSPWSGNPASQGAASVPPPMLIPSDAPPTQRYQLAPNAPAYPNPPGNAYPAPPAGYQPAPGQPYMQQPFAQGGMPQNMSGGTGAIHPYASQPMLPVEAGSGLDAVTIVLAMIAFFAVACLIPLYIAVFQAQVGG